MEEEEFVQVGGNQEFCHMRYHEMPMKCLCVDVKWNISFRSSGERLELDRNSGVTDVECCSNPKMQRRHLKRING